MTQALRTRTTGLSPILKWAGGKRWLVPRLQALWSGHDHRRFVEPFAGGLAITLGLVPEHALLNDVNPHLISFYRWVKRGLRFDEVDVRLEYDRHVFQMNRARFNDLIARGEHESAEAAVLFFFLNKSAFNGLVRFNQRGEFNTPFGRYKRVTFQTEFPEHQALFAQYDFACGDFCRLALRPDDFIYADPPYDVEFTTYSAGGFDWNDQVRLAAWLALHPGPVVVSNQATRRVLKLYREHGFSVHTLNAPRRIACNGNREDAREMLATRNL